MIETSLRAYIFFGALRRLFSFHDPLRNRSTRYAETEARFFSAPEKRFGARAVHDGSKCLRVPVLSKTLDAAPHAGPRGLPQGPSWELHCQCVRMRTGGLALRRALAGKLSAYTAYLHREMELDRFLLTCALVPNWGGVHSTLDAGVAFLFTTAQSETI